jgi:hypothetical protein
MDPAIKAFFFIEKKLNKVFVGRAASYMEDDVWRCIKMYEKEG